MNCKFCNGNNVTKKGKRKGKFGLRQIYLCKKCGKRFNDKSLGYKTYNANIIINALCYYNLGFTLYDVKRKVNRQFKVKIGASNIHNWLKEYKELCGYGRLRERFLKSFGKGNDILVSQVFRHKGLDYNFRYHKGKISFVDNGYYGLVKYVKNFENNKPDPKIFENDSRCSRFNFDFSGNVVKKKNHACKLAELALKGCKNNKERHELVEKFMLCNDSCTFASEVPVWFWDKKLGGICGHIDLIQYRFGKMYIVDYKPEASKEKKAPSQLYLYALALSFRTRIPLRKFTCAWFDEKNYFEFNPSGVKIRW